ncbi:MAG: 23S rRNA (adenine(2503)-C(2))-methyltransferase RlmN [Phycisphaerales bacterium]
MPGPAPSRPDPLALTSGAFVAAARGAGSRPDLALDAYRRAYREGRTDLPDAHIALPPIAREQSEEGPEGVTTKFVSRLDAGDTPVSANTPHLDIESVVIPMVGKSGRRTHTLCVSSQVGCAMGCGFCETAQMGLIRSLSTSEIVAQWFAARHALRGARGIEVSNIVFMGMGEPLDNFDNVARAIEVLTDPNGAALAPSKITISTVGRIDGLERLGTLVARPGFHRLGLAISINAPRDEVRSRIMPINRAMPMGALRDALLAFPHTGKRKICFEYVLIPGVNDAPADAADLAEWLRPFGAIGDTGESRTPLALLNVIPYNPRRDSSWPAPTEESVADFMARLRELGVYAKRRRTKGRTLMGACGQLGAAEIRKRRYVGVSISA